MIHTDPVAFTLFGVSVYWYGVLISIGAILGITIASLREKRLGLQDGTALDFVLICLPVALICARLYYVIFQWDEFQGDIVAIISFRGGGLAIYGGVIGGAAAGYFFTRRRHVRFSALADLCAPALAIGQAIGRWGNFVNQEAYGAAITDKALQFFPLAVWIEKEGAWFAATFFYESMWCLMTCAALLIMERRHFFRRGGDTFLWYLLLYGVERMAVEQLRTDSLWLGPVRVSQILSLLAVAVVLSVFFLRGVKRGGRVAAFAGALCLLGATIALAAAGQWVLQLPLDAAVIALGAWLYRGTPERTV